MLRLPPLATLCKTDASLWVAGPLLRAPATPPAADPEGRTLNWQANSIRTSRRSAVVDEVARFDVGIFFWRWPPAPSSVGTLWTELDSAAARGNFHGMVRYLGVKRKVLATLASSAMGQS